MDLLEVSLSTCVSTRLRELFSAIIINMSDTIYYNAERLRVDPDHTDATFKLEIHKNPLIYGVGNGDARKWDSVGVSIRQGNFKMCQGGISTGFFSGDTATETSVIFMLYYLSTSRGGKGREALIGFALANDLRLPGDKDGEAVAAASDQGTLYINAICTNTDVRRLPDGGMSGTGIILMGGIETFAISDKYTSIKLSALPYVIGYYRRLGYRHINDCSDLVRERNGEWVERDRDIFMASEEQNGRFRNDEELDYALKAELAKEKRILTPKGSVGDREQQDYLIANLNEYFRPDNIIFRNVDDGSIMAMNVDGEVAKPNEYVTRLITIDNSALLRLLDVLRSKQFSVACDDSQGRSMRHNVRKDSDGEIEFHCLDEGFTMRKCLYLHKMMGGGLRSRSGRRSGKNYKSSSICRMPGKRRRRSKRLTRKKVPWAGWGKLSPNSRQRTTMKRRCGKKCFLGPRMSFPVCAKGTCRISKKGAWAAFVRAKEWGKRYSTYKGKSIAKMAKRIINS